MKTKRSEALQIQLPPDKSIALLNMNVKEKKHAANKPNKMGRIHATSIAEKPAVSKQPFCNRLNFPSLYYDVRCFLNSGKESDMKATTLTMHLPPLGERLIEFVYAISLPHVTFSRTYHVYHLF